MLFLFSLSPSSPPSTLSPFRKRVNRIRRHCSMWGGKAERENNTETKVDRNGEKELWSVKERGGGLAEVEC